MWVLKGGVGGWGRILHSGIRSNTSCCLRVFVDSFLFGGGILESRPRVQYIKTGTNEGKRGLSFVHLCSRYILRGQKTRRRGCQVERTVRFFVFFVP